MKILLSGANGYIGKRLLPALVKQGHQVVCCVRDENRFSPPPSLKSNIEILEIDFLDPESVHKIPRDIDGAYYLIHSMSSAEDYSKIELLAGSHFRKGLSQTNVEHVVSLSGIVNQNVLSDHLKSRKAVEDELARGSYNFTTLRAGIIIGSGSASFEIIRDLVEKLPLMVAPKWLNTRTQPIGIEAIIKYLYRSLFNPAVYGQNIDIGGPDVLTYKEMLLGYAKVRKLNRWIITIPVMTPKLSSYWLYFVTSTSYKLARALVGSMKIEVVCRDNSANELLEVDPENYTSALERTFGEIAENQIISSWKDSLISGRFENNISDFIHVPTYGCLVDKRSEYIENRDTCLAKIWRIGGASGWYYANWLWELRGFVDKIFGGVGLRRGRTDKVDISVGDAIDFWRVLYANKQEGRLLLFAEMKLPGEAWLEFKVSGNELHQTATFRPQGIRGRIYWYMVYPIHGLIFGNMLKRLCSEK